MERNVTENNKSSGGSAPPTGPSIWFPKMSMEEIDYSCKVMVEEYKADPIEARMFFFHNSVWVRRNGRKNAAEIFLKEYVYGNGNDKKTIISPGDTLSWQDESSGIMWVGVHGIDSICVVTRSGDLDVTRLRGRLVHLPMHKVSFNFRKSLINEIEDLGDASSKLHQRFHQKIEKPFGVVSVIPYTDKASINEYGETKAIEFLQEKLNSDLVFTVNETIQTAIGAFQQLFQKEFNTNELQVSVMDPKYVAADKYRDPTVEELHMDQISEHLNVINNRGKIVPCLEDTYSDDSRKPREWKLHSCSGNSTITPEAAD